MPVVSTENVSVFIPLILRGKVSGSGGTLISMGVVNGLTTPIIEMLILVQHA